MFGLKVVKQEEYELLLSTRVELINVLEEWEQLGRAIRKFADGKVTLGEITGRLNLLQTRQRDTKTCKPTPPPDRIIRHFR